CLVRARLDPVTLRLRQVSLPFSCLGSFLSLSPHRGPPSLLPTLQSRGLFVYFVRGFGRGWAVDHTPPLPVTFRVSGFKTSAAVPLRRCFASCGE
ncbi:MAG: hypothetical protein ACK559_26135, partial [bacterium]